MRNTDSASEDARTSESTDERCGLLMMCVSTSVCECVSWIVLGVAWAGLHCRDSSVGMCGRFVLLDARRDKKAVTKRVAAALKASHIVPH